MQMTGFERKGITLCVMTGFLESSNTQTELAIYRGGGGLISPMKMQPNISLPHQDANISEILNIRK